MTLPTPAVQIDVEALIGEIERASDHKPEGVTSSVAERWKMVKNPNIAPAVSSGTALCQCRSPVLSECQPLMASPAIPIRAGISSSEVTVGLENPERRFMKVGIQ